MAFSKVVLQSLFSKHSDFSVLAMAFRFSTGYTHQWILIYLPSHLEVVGLASGVLGIKLPVNWCRLPHCFERKSCWILWPCLALNFNGQVCIEVTGLIFNVSIVTFTIRLLVLRLRRRGVFRFYSSCAVCCVRFGMAWIRKHGM
jgi:hypothetical protein